MTFACRTALLSQWGCTAEVLVTIPVHKLARITLYDAFMNFNEDSNFEAFTIADVDSALRVQHKGGPVTPLRFWQYVQLHGVELVAVPAGRTLGGASWVIQKGQERLVYAVGYNHMTEAHLQGAALLGAAHAGSASQGALYKQKPVPLLQKPTALITDTLHTLTASAWASDAAVAASSDAAAAGTLSTQSRHLLDPQEAPKLIVQHALRVMANGGNVLMPVDASCRVLELLLQMDRTWDARFPLVFLSRMGTQIVQYARTHIEWMRDDISADFQDTRQVPFDFSRVRLVSSMAELEGMRQPLCVLTPMDSLESGFGKQLLLQWSSSPANSILFTQRAPAGSLAAAMQAKPPPRAVEVQWTTRQAMTEQEIKERDRQLAAQRQAEARASASAAPDDGDLLPGELGGLEEQQQDAAAADAAAGQDSGDTPQADSRSAVQAAAPSAAGDKRGRGGAAAGGAGFPWCTADDDTELPMLGANPFQVDGDADTSASGLPRPSKRRHRGVAGSSPMGDSLRSASPAMSRGSPADSLDRSSPALDWLQPAAEPASPARMSGAAPGGGDDAPAALPVAADVQSLYSSFSTQHSLRPSGIAAVKQVSLLAAVRPRAKASWGAFGMPDKHKPQITPWGQSVRPGTFLESATSETASPEAAAAAEAVAPAAVLPATSALQAVQRHLNFIASGDASVTGNAEVDAADLQLLDPQQGMPMKTVAQTLKVALLCNIMCIPMDGRPTGEDTRNLLQAMAPQRLVLVGGTLETTAWLANNSNGLQGCISTHLPSEAEKVDVASGTAWANMLLRADLADGAAAHLGSYSMGRFRGFAAAADTPKGLPQLLASEDSLVTAQAAQTGQLLLREEALTLKTARRALDKAGVKASLRNRELLTDEGIVLRVAPAGVKGTVGRVVVEGFLCDEFFKVQDALYAMYCRV